MKHLKMKYPNVICLLESKAYGVGSLPPTGYLAWHEWTKAQHKGGLHQIRCPETRRFEFSQEHKVHAKRQESSETGAA